MGVPATDFGNGLPGLAQPALFKDIGRSQEESGARGWGSKTVRLACGSWSLSLERWGNFLRALDKAVALTGFLEQSGLSGALAVLVAGVTATLDYQ